jgi:hypothetical protein
MHAPYTIKPRRRTLNDSDRAQWVDNHEGLYKCKRSSRLPMRQFVRENRAEIDAVINAALDQPPSR